MRFPKLHPDAQPKKEEDSHIEYSTLRELCEAVVFAEGWQRIFKTQAVPDSSLVQVVYLPEEEADFDAGDPPIVFTESEANFKEGQISRTLIKSYCLEFLRDR